MAPQPAYSPRNENEFCYDVAKLTRDLTIDDFSDVDLSEITYDAYTSSMESLNSIRSSNKVNPLLPQRRTPLSRSQSLRDTNKITQNKWRVPSSDTKDSLSLSDERMKPSYYENKKERRTLRASFKELCSWGVFRPLVVDAAIVRGKIVMPTHVGSFRLASRSKEQLSVEIGEPLFIDVNNVDIRDDWVQGTSLRTGRTGMIPSLYATSIECPPMSFNLYYIGSTKVGHHRGGNVLWPGVQKCLERKVRPIQICLIISNDGIRIVQMGQIRKRDFVQADHLLTYSTFIPLHLVSYCGTHPSADRYFAFISRNFDPEQGCAAHAFVSQSSTLSITSAMERAFKQGFSSQFDCEFTVDEYLE